MTIKEQIMQHLKKYKAATVTLFYELVTSVILRNSDFRLVLDAERDDPRPIIEEDTGRRIDFSLEEMVGMESKTLLKRAEELEFSGKKLLKVDRIELIADILSDDTLFEGFCLTASGEEEDPIEEICIELGCYDRYQVLVKNPVFKKRRQYFQRIVAYAMAAVNLYGVVHIMELEDIIWNYEGTLQKTGGFLRREGNYQRSIFFDPRYFGMFTLKEILGNYNGPIN